MGAGKQRREEAEATGRGKPEAEALVAELTLDNRALKDVM